MTTLVLGFLAIGAAAAVIDWVAVAFAREGLERVAKPAALLALIGAAVVMTPVSDAVRPWLLAALAASLAGDVLLLPPGRFVPGLVAFLAAQLAYLVAFMGLPGSGIWAAAGAAMATVLVVGVGRTIVAGARPSGLAAPVAVYLAAICGMAIAATWTGLPLAIIGAWLFVASDAILGWDRFAAVAPRSPRAAAARRLAVIVPYHLGQALLVVALAG
jgi:uncharacterized membrane protein YhhN